MRLPSRPHLTLCLGSPRRLPRANGVPENVGGLPRFLIMHYLVPDYAATILGATDGPGRSLVFYFRLKRSFNPEVRGAAGHGKPWRCERPCHRTDLQNAACTVTPSPSLCCAPSPSLALLRPRPRSLCCAPSPCKPCHLCDPPHRRSRTSRPCRCCGGSWRAERRPTGRTRVTE